VPAGSYRVKISFIGYRTTNKDNLVISRQTPQHNLGTIRLNASAHALDEVVVSAEQPLFEQSIDKRVFNVEKSIVTQGGSATDILETIPSVAVDVDGNLSLRGSGGVVVLIDGKPSSLTGADRSAILEQIPASAIESVEVITNPSSRYDADGMSGIINIVLKKNKLQGSNGSASVSVGTLDKYNAAINYNYRTPKFNIFSSYSYRYNTFFGRGYNTRELLGNTNTAYRLQNSNEIDRSSVHLFRAGADYFINDQTTLGFSALYGIRRESEDERTENKVLDQQQTLTELFYRNNEERENGNNMDLVMNFSRKFARKKQELTASAAYSTFEGSTNTLFNDLNYDLDFMPSAELPRQTRNLRDIDNTVITLQADYVHPVGEAGKFEGGYKSILREVDNDLVFENFRHGSQLWAFNDTLSNRFLYQEYVHSLYANYTSTLGKFGYQLGTRLEQTMMNPVQEAVPGNFRRNYLGFFPSLFLSYKLKGEQQFQLNYSRRINRPNLRELNPFINFSDTLNIRFGNPYLNPEYTNSYELSYLTAFKSIFLTSSVYYRRTNDIIQRIVSVNPDNIATTTFQNLDNRDSYGFEFIAKTNVTKWWSFTTNFNFFRQKWSVIACRQILTTPIIAGRLC
jgi:outer membrane receptor protein involved in Fe transport